MTDEYIKRSKALEELNKIPAYLDNGDIQYGVVIAINTIKNVPAADVAEVVRCKDCKNFKILIGHVVGNCVKHDRITYNNDFCSYVERKNNNDKKEVC